MAEIAPQLLEVRGTTRISRDAQTGPFHNDAFELNMQLADHIVDVLTLGGQTVRHQIAMTIGANLIYMRASSPVTVFYGTSIEGHETDLFLVHGHFPQGILVTCNVSTELRIIVAKEAT